jgi:hypothetical protein
VRVLVYEDKAAAIQDRRAKSVRVIGYGDTPALDMILIRSTRHYQSPPR